MLSTATSTGKAWGGNIRNSGFNCLKSVRPMVSVSPWSRKRQTQVDSATDSTRTRCHSEAAWAAYTFPISTAGNGLLSCGLRLPKKVQYGWINLEVVEVHITQESVQPTGPSITEKSDCHPGDALNSCHQNLGISQVFPVSKCIPKGKIPAKHHHQAAEVGEEGWQASLNMLRTQHT